MRDEATAVDIHPANIAAPIEIQPHMRVLHGMRRPANWLQLVRFGLVGGVGFVVNLAVYTLCVHAAGIDYHVAAVAAWLVAVVNNFVLNRHWTFDARSGRAHFQAVRFVAVSLVALGFSLLILMLLVEAVGVPKVAAQALAVSASMPLNFLGNKLWSFRAEDEGIPAAEG
jgi:putative flippase GtrA